MQLLMDNVDTLQQDLYRLLGYEKNLAKQQQAKQQFIQRRVRLVLIHKLLPELSSFAVLRAWYITSHVRIVLLYYRL